MHHPMTRFRFTIGYDGTAYAGWQVQPHDPSVQQAIESVLTGIVCHPVKLHGSGRTDRGVHARGQVAHVDLATRMDPAALQRALNARLPADIRVLAAARARPDFHARRSAVGKEYRYFIWSDAVLPPERRLYAAHAYRPLDAGRMQAAASFFVGTRDFAAFTANPNREVEGTVRTVFAATVTRRGKELVFRVSGSGFLYKQVRSMVGFLLRVGEGAEEPGAVGQLLGEAAARSARVPSAPPHGLFLWRVWYRRPKAGGSASREGVVL
jgi:tRNA pseudouridine38-40 synthase